MSAGNGQETMSDWHRVFQIFSSGAAWTRFSVLRLWNDEPVDVAVRVLAEGLGA